MSSRKENGVKMKHLKFLGIVAALILVATACVVPSDSPATVADTGYIISWGETKAFSRIVSNDEGFVMERLTLTFGGMSDGNEMFYLMSKIDGKDQPVQYLDPKKEATEVITGVSVEAVWLLPTGSESVPAIRVILGDMWVLVN